MGQVARFRLRHTDRMLLDTGYGLFSHCWLLSTVIGRGVGKSTDISESSFLPLSLSLFSISLVHTGEKVFSSSTEH